MEKINPRTMVVCGPTASGKTRRAVEIAREFGGEIISADSRQVYRRMDIGTGKDLEEYQSIPYHLIDIAEPGSKYNLYNYLRDFDKVYSDLQQRDVRAIICGGSGMYLENAIKGIRLPEVGENEALRERLRNFTLPQLTELLKTYKTLHNITDVDTCARAIRAIEIQEYYKVHPDLAQATDARIAKPIDCCIIGLDISRTERRTRISRRLFDRTTAGLVMEVENLINEGVSADNLIYYGLEYKYVTLYVTGILSFEEMMEQLEIAIHQFAKRQMTWLRGMERRGLKIHWLPYDMPTEAFLEAVGSLL